MLYGTKRVKEGHECIPWRIKYRAISIKVESNVMGITFSITVLTESKLTPWKMQIALSICVIKKKKLTSVFTSRHEAATGGLIPYPIQ